MARNLPQEKLLARPVEELTAGIVADTIPQQITLDVGSRHVSTQEATVHEIQGIYWGGHASFEEMLGAARAELGTTTITDTVTEALRRATLQRQRRTAAALDVLADARLDERADAWR